MWIDWEPREHAEDHVTPPSKPPPAYIPKKTHKVDHYTRELINENKRLWVELKEKNEQMICIRDDLYSKEHELQQLSSYKEELHRLKNEDQYLELIREINRLKDDQREKQALVSFLNETIENLCDEVLQNEHVEGLEADVAFLETSSQRLSKENSELKVRLKIVEYENDKLHTRSEHLEAECHSLKVKLEKTAKRLKDKESSMLSFKKFSELATNLQTRISRSKNENQTLKSVIDRMKHIAGNYEKLESENALLKEALREIEVKNEELRNRVFQLQDTQLKMKESEMVTKPALAQENTQLKQRLLESAERVESLIQDNAKLKTNLTIYEKLLIDNKAYIKEQERRGMETHAIREENVKLKVAVDELNRTLQQEGAERGRLVDENHQLAKEKERIGALVKEMETSKLDAMEDAQALRREYEDAESRLRDLRKQLQIYKNTVQNQENTLKLRNAEIDGLLRENKELKLKIKQYESQVQMEGKVYKIVR